MNKIKGHCLCKDVAWCYEKTGKIWACHCHCKDCTRQCAAPIVSFIGVSLAKFQWTGAKSAIFNSSKGVRRHFCKRCGTPMAFDADHYQGEIYLYAATLEDREAFQPECHVHYKSKLPWVHWQDDLPKYDGFLPSP